MSPESEFEFDDVFDAFEQLHILDVAEDEVPEEDSKSFLEDDLLDNMLFAGSDENDS